MSGFDTEVPPELTEPVRTNPVQAALNDHAKWQSHMSQEETELLGYLDEYEAARYARGRLADAVAELAA